MIMKIFSCRDSAVNAYLQPFFAATPASAIRSLKEAVNDPKHEFHKHASDYSLWLMGEFDDSTGVVSGGDPVRLIGAVDLLGVD